MVKKVFCTFSTMILLVAISLCVIDRGYSEAASKDRILAKVGEVNITEKQVEKYSMGAMAHQDKVDQSLVINELVNRAIMYQEAKRLGLDKREDIRELMEEYERNILIQALMKEKSLLSEPVTEEKARYLYDNNWMDSKYPRWVGVTILKVNYKTKDMAERALAYITKLRENVKSEEFEKDSNAALDRLKKDMPPPDGMDLSMAGYKKIFLPRFRKFKTDIEEIALKLKKGENCQIIKAGQQPVYLFVNLTTEYPKEEIDFNKVVSDLMMSASELLYKEKVKNYVDTVKGNYKIEYYSK